MLVPHTWCICSAAALLAKLCGCWPATDVVPSSCFSTVVAELLYGTSRSGNEHVARHCLLARAACNELGPSVPFLMPVQMVQLSAWAINGLALCALMCTRVLSRTTSCRCGSKLASLCCRFCRQQPAIRGSCRVAHSSQVSCVCASHS
jgi:hypothetical protein